MTELREALPGGRWRVERVVAHRVAMPLQMPVRSGIHSIEAIHTFIVEVHGGGQVGTGYAFAFAANEVRAIAALAEDLAEVVVRAEHRGVREHWLAMREHLNFIGQTGPGAMAMAAIDTALWDLHARHAGLPLYRLLGAGGRQGIEAYAAGGWLSWSMEQVIEEARAFAAAGYRAYKMRVGSADWREDVARVRGVRAALADEVGLMVDVNQAWSLDTALRAGRALEDVGLLWIEEPIDAHDYAGQARLARELLTPVAAGETLWGDRELTCLLDAGGVDVLQLDLMRCGGITPLLAVLARLEARGLRVTSHLFTHTSAHLLAIAAGAPMAEHLPGWFDPLFEQAPRVIGGRLVASDKPGLGLTLSREALERWELR